MFAIAEGGTRREGKEMRIEALLQIELISISIEL